MFFKYLNLSLSECIKYFAVFKLKSLKFLLQFLYDNAKVLIKRTTTSNAFFNKKKKKQQVKDIIK